MGPGVWAARRSALLLWRRAACPLAGRAAAPARRPPAGPADLLRGLHRAPQPEERPAGEGGPRPGAADHSGPKFDIDMLVSLLRQENARDICVIKVPPEMRYTDYFVIGSGTSTRHLHAMAYYIVKMYKYLKNKSESHVKIEGKDTDDWMCVDFGSMVVHLMLPETRETYELEKLWTLRSYDDQLAEIPPETLPQDFILGIEDTSFPTPVDLKCE